VNPGGDIEIHGLGEKWGWVGARHRSVDWTDGCIAVSNEEIEEIYSLVEIGTPVEIKPERGERRSRKCPGIEKPRGMI